MGNVHCCISEVAESGGTLLTLCFHTIHYVYGSFGSIIASWFQMVWRNTKTLKWPHVSSHSCGVSALRLAGSKYPANWFHQLIQVPFFRGHKAIMKRNTTTAQRVPKRVDLRPRTIHVMIIAMFLIVIPSGIVELMWNASKEIGLPDFTRNPESSSGITTGSRCSIGVAMCRPASGCPRVWSTKGQERPLENPSRFRPS